MEQKGRVRKFIDQNTVEVAIVRQSACGDSCSSCGGSCEITEVIVCAKLLIPDVEVGDLVQIVSSTRDILLSAFIGYMIPFICFVSGIAAGAWYFKQAGNENYELFGFGLGLIGLVISFFIVRVAGDKFSESKSKFEIEAILQKQR